MNFFVREKGPVWISSRLRESHFAHSYTVIPHDIMQLQNYFKPPRMVWALLCIYWINGPAKASFFSWPHSYILPWYKVTPLAWEAQVDDCCKACFMSDRRACFFSAHLITTWGHEEVVSCTASTNPSSTPSPCPVSLDGSSNLAHHALTLGKLWRFFLVSCVLVLLDPLGIVDTHGEVGVDNIDVDPINEAITSSASSAIFAPIGQDVFLLTRYRSQ